MSLPSKKAAHPEAKFKVMIVDDNSDFLYVLSHLLDNKKYTIDTATNGQEAFQKIMALEERRIHILITDYNMPFLNGGDLIRQLILNEIQIDKTIIMSGLDENKENIGDLLDDPKIQFVPKFMDITNLIKAILK